MSLKKKYACETFVHGSPTHCVIMCDAMTASAGQTPKYGERNSKSDTSFFENRVLAVEVYCGPIQGEMLVHVDALVRGGANLIIDILRLGMKSKF